MNRFSNLMLAIAVIAATAIGTKGQIQNVLLEQHTGAWCGWCPDGSVKMDEILALYGSQVIGVKIHNGDAMEIPEQSQIADALGLSFYPTGSVDRRDFGGSVFLDRGDWKTACESRIRQRAKAEVDCFYTLDRAARVVRIQVVANIVESMDFPLKFNAFIVEDDVTGTGSGYDQKNYLSGRAGWENNPYYNQPSLLVGYHHMKVVRKMMGGAWGVAGDLPASVNAGEFYSHTFESSIDGNWNIDKLHFVGMLQADAQDNKQIVNSAIAVEGPYPADGAIDVIRSPILTWLPGGSGLQYDVYFGGDEQALANATPQTPGIYRGRQPPEMTTYEPGCLRGRKTYYWRIDGVHEGDPNSPWKGDVWRFTTVDFMTVAVVDDFESYTQDIAAGMALFQTWIGGLMNGTASLVLFAEQTIVHSGKQSMPMGYYNGSKPWYSQAERAWGTPQDWTTNHADTLTLYLRGDPNNARDSLYVAIEDSAGRIAVVTHPDANAVLTSEWQEWHIALADLKAAGVNVAAVKNMCIRVGDGDNPQPGGAGRIYIDDIRLTWRFLSVDFDGDMDTDFLDFCILGQRWLGSDSSFWCGQGCDLTNDGSVNWQDLMVFAKNWISGVGP